MAVAADEVLVMYATLAVMMMMMMMYSFAAAVAVVDVLVSVHYSLPSVYHSNFSQILHSLQLDPSDH